MNQIFLSTNDKYFSDTQRYSLQFTTFVSSGLSIIGCICIIIAYLLIPKLRSFSIRLLLWLSIADFFAAISHYIPHSTFTGCYSQAIMQQFFFLSSFLWMDCFAINQYKVISAREMATWKFESVFHILCWGVPLISVFIDAGLGAFGPTELWCWIPLSHPLPRWILFYIPLLGTILLILITYSHLYCRLTIRRRRQFLAERESENFGQYPILRFESNSSNKWNDPTFHVQRQLIFYLIAFIIIRIPSIIDRILEISHNESSFLIAFLHAVGSPLQGFINACLFFSSRAVINALSIKIWAQWRTTNVNDLIGTNKITTSQELEIFIGTWNMGNSPPPNAHELTTFLKSWFIPGRYDIYAIGTQEADYTIPSDATSCADHWYRIIREHAGPEYIPVGATSLRHTRLIVLARRSLSNTLSNVKMAKEATGLVNVAGNKGCVAISFQVKEFHLAFVNVHLHAHKEKIEARNSDLIQIINRLNIVEPDCDITTRFHSLFLFGDMNYRIDLPPAEVLISLSSASTPSTSMNQALNSFKEYDQLLKQRKEKKLLCNFEEGEIKFPPTYKLLPLEKNNDLYRTNFNRTYSGSRTPSWTDRVLICPRDSVITKIIEYNSIKSITSDHLPVRAIFRLGLPKMDLRTLREIDEDKDDIQNQIQNHKQNKSKYKYSTLTRGIIELTSVTCFSVHGPSNMVLEAPYITFYSDALSPTGQRSGNAIRISRADDFEWRNIRLKLDPSIKIETLYRMCISLVIKDQSLLSECEVVGQACLELGSALISKNIGDRFKVPITCNTIPNGTLQGLLKILP